VPGLSDQEVKKISQNMPGVYDLLPTQKYYDISGSFVKIIDQGNPIDFFDDTETNLNYQEFENYLTQDKNLNQTRLLPISSYNIPLVNLSRPCIID